MDASSGSSSRRIEFHLARKPFNRFSKDFHVETLNPSEGNTEAQKRSSSDLHLKKTEASASLDNSLDAELSFRITFRRIGAGLQNLGNTCFLNSVLQCLTYTEPLAAYLQSGKHQISCRTAGFCALCAIQRHVSRALQSTGRILAPKDLVSNLRCISRSFRNSRQEDAHEYMVNLLESMHRCCLPSGMPIESPTAYEKSLVHKIFGGRLRSQVKCMECSFCSDKFDPFLDLSLEIIKADTLHKALAHFTAKEQLDGGERQYQCQQCKQKVKALKQLKIHKTPCVLTIHLKRFGSHWSGQKIDKQVQFGPILDLKPFVTDPQDGDFKYTLYSVLVHYGWSTHSGHYYCFVRTSSGMWYGLDDNRVTQVSEKRVLEQKAYMLFYVRDRKNFVPKRPLDIIQKENMVQAMRNRTEPTGVVLKESIQNGAIVKGASVPNSSAAVLSGDVSNAGVSKKILTNEPSSFQDTDLMISERPALKGKTKQESLSKEPSLKDSLLENLSASILNRGEYFPQSDSLFRESNVHAKLDNADISKLNAEVSKYSQNASSKRDLHNSITLPDNCNGSQSFISKDSLNNSIVAPATYTRASAKKDVEDATIVPSNSDITRIFSGKMVDEKVSAKCYSEKIPGDIGSARSKCTKSRDSEIGGSLKRPDGDGDIGNSGQHDQRKSGSEFGELSSQEIVNHMSLTGNSLHRKRQHKLNKKLIKCQLTNMHLSSNMLLRASLGVRKKKKHKRSKEHSVETNLYPRFLPDSDCVPTDVVPSTSVRMDGCVQLQTKCVESTLNKKGTIVDNALDSRSDIRIGMVHEQFRERIGQHGAELSSEVQPQNNFSITSVGNKSDGKNPSSKENKQVLRQNDLISMLTRGLEETTVARWNGIDSPSSQIVESSCMENVGVGYVADEWDEEYDRGKRKKLRSHQNNFGGPNLFQEIATKKATIKKPRLDKSAGNEPFRI